MKAWPKFSKAAAFKVLMMPSAAGPEMALDETYSIVN
jgi:hypothetical protein